MDPASWGGGFAGFGQPMDNAQLQEDWEDWLRWDPAAELTTSPEDGTGTAGSASSHNDSPITSKAFPLRMDPTSGLFEKNDDLLSNVPPLIMGEDGLGLGTTDGMLFGANEIVMPVSFDFQPQPPLNPTDMTKTTSNGAVWSLPSHATPQDMDVVALLRQSYGSSIPNDLSSSRAPSLHYSPQSTTRQGTSVSSNSPDPPKKRGGRKRKVEIEQELNEANGDSNEDGDGDGDEPPMKKTSHNVIEKRYRNNLNDKIVELRNSVPSLRAMSRANGSGDTEDLEGLTPAHKLNKATVMAKATEYIKHLEKRNKVMGDEMTTLKARLAAVEAAIGKSVDRDALTAGIPLTGTMTPRHGSSRSSQSGPLGFMNPAHAQSRFPQPVMQQPYAQSHAQPAYQRAPNPPAEAQNQPRQMNPRGRPGVMNMITMGGMAGLMVMEGFNEQQQPGDGANMHGLYAIPVHLFKRATGNPSDLPVSMISRHAALPLLKLSLVIAALLYLLPPLFMSLFRPKQKSRPLAISLPSSPCLASPIEVRRKAWLTAIQTVWVPKHFLFEVVMVTAKMFSLSIRRLIGSEALNQLTGSSKEDESARIKAWDIAIDAQLAGGDAEVSYYRLLLTLMESGTLPDSPTRLMQKAIHFRVFFWEVAEAGFGNCIGFKQLTEEVGKFYWDSARRQQKELVRAQAEGRVRGEDDGVDVLPDHLAALLELDCDDVLGDEMVQRAYNLAWNKPSAYHIAENPARDAVVEDHAVRSPLDAVAAWYSHMIMDDRLSMSLDDQHSQYDTEYCLGLAVAIAPPTSATQARALAARAILSHSNRDKNVLIALEALPGASQGPGGINVVKHLPAAPDVRAALTLAKLLSLSVPSAAPASHARAYQSLGALHLPPASFTLLTAVASYRLLKILVERNLPIDAKHGAEDLAANLRVWVGTSAGRSAALDREQCGRVIELCLTVAKRVGGWDEDRDSGYGSAETSPARSRANTDLTNFTRSY